VARDFRKNRNAWQRRTAMGLAQDQRQPHQLPRDQQDEDAALHRPPMVPVNLLPVAVTRRRIAVWGGARDRDAAASAAIAPVLGEPCVACRRLTIGPCVDVKRFAACRGSRASALVLAVAELDTRAFEDDRVWMTCTCGVGDQPGAGIRERRVIALNSRQPSPPRCPCG